MQYRIQDNKKLFVRKEPRFLMVNNKQQIHNNTYPPQNNAPKMLTILATNVIIPVVSCMAKKAKLCICTSIGDTGFSNEGLHVIVTKC